MPDAALITTPRFILREFAEHDRNAFVGSHMDPKFSLYHLDSERGAEHASAVFDLFLAWRAERPRRNIQLAVIRRGDAGNYVGNVGARTENQPTGRAELGIELLPSYWGRGVATEIMEAFLPWSKRRLKIVSFAAETVPGNSAAEHLARKAGLRSVRQASKTAWCSD